MKNFTVLISCFLLMATGHAAPSLITAKGFVDVRSGKLIRPANILINAGKIVAINDPDVPNDAVIIDLQNKILMPGLMDMHVHLDMDFEPGYNVLTVTENGSKATLRAAKNAERTLMAGFTTIRNVGQVSTSLELINVAVNDAINKGWISGPRIIASGHIISITGGHGDLSMGLGLSEGVLELGPKHGIINGVNDAIAAVRYQIKHGAKAIKVTATAGVLSLEESVGAQQVSNEEMAAMVAEASRHHITVAAHAHGAEGINEAIKMGVRSIEHGSMLNAEGIRLMKKHDVFLVPTTGLVDVIIGRVDELDPIMAAKAQYVLPLAAENLSKAIKADVKIALGTDAPLIPHGKNAQELIAMSKRGMSNKTALKTATINPAEMLYLTDRGEIKVGLVADIIAVDDNPLENINTLEQVQFVMKDGVVYKNIITP